MRRRTFLSKNKGGNIITTTYQGYTSEIKLLGDNFNLDNVNKIYVNGVEITKTKNYNHKKEEIFNVIFEMADELTDLSYMFDSTYIKTCDFTKCDLSKVTTMSYLFNNSNIESINFEGVDTSSLTNMEYMFNYCYDITEIDLSHFNVSNVTTMYCLFRTTHVKTINILGWDTSNVTDMSNMFDDCPFCENLIVDNFDTSNVTSMRAMFYGYGEGFPTSQVITDTLLPLMDTSNVTDMSEMFQYGCGSYDLSKFNTCKVEDMSHMFAYCENYYDANLGLEYLDTSNVTNMAYMFAGCHIKSLTLPSNFDTTNVTNMQGMFRYFDGTSLNISILNTSNVTNMNSMFEHCEVLTSLSFTNFNTAKVTNMGYMFNACYKLTTLNLSKFNLSKVTNMNYMFQNCTALTSITMTGARNVSAGFTTTTRMFNGVTTTGTFKYKSKYYFDDILAALPTTWTATAS